MPEVNTRMEKSSHRIESEYLRLPTRCVFKFEDGLVFAGKIICMVKS